MKTVLFANNYETKAARSGLRQGVYPDHHMFGMDTPAPGFRVVDLPVSDAIGGWGDRRLQWEALREGPGVLFAANATTVRGLMALRRARVFRSPIVAVVHEVPARNGRPSERRLHGNLLRGADRIIAMCESTRSGLIDDVGIDPMRVSVAEWGPDAEFAPFLAAPRRHDGPIVSLGKSNRDAATALKALAHVGRPARVYVRSDVGEPVPPNVELVAAVPPRRLPHQPSSYDYVMKDLANAALVLIPLHARATALQGLTELNDALACGKPVVMTRVPYIDLDIEAEGVGRWVDPGDWRGMADAMESVLADRANYEAMSARAREVVNERWNSRRFGTHVWDVVTGLG